MKKLENKISEDTEDLKISTRRKDYFGFQQCMDWADRSKKKQREKKQSELNRIVLEKEKYY